MRTMIGNDGSLDTSTECWLAPEKDKGECWVKWTLPDKLAAPPPSGEWVLKRRYAGKVVPLVSPVTSQHTTQLLSCWAREAQCNGRFLPCVKKIRSWLGAWGEKRLWTVAHEMNGSVHTSYIKIHMFSLATSCKPHSTEEYKGEEQAKFWSILCFNLISDLSKCHFILFFIYSLLLFCATVKRVVKVVIVNKSRQNVQIQKGKN